ncbi:hypothetical protein [Deinococcus sonorensis]|uniref:Uncharacterized protein n=2 Tax=Deinococcus sonorensis TaxID=309891 RepID=A0AAU7U712_9DEIO
MTLNEALHELRHVEAMVNLAEELIAMPLHRTPEEAKLARSMLTVSTALLATLLSSTDPLRAAAARSFRQAKNIQNLN